MATPAVRRIETEQAHQRAADARQMALATAEAAATHLKRAVEAEQQLEAMKLSYQCLYDDFELMAAKLNQEGVSDPSKASVYAWTVMGGLFVAGGLLVSSPEWWAFCALCALICLATASIKTDLTS